VGGLRLAVIGADEPVGEALFEELQERDLAVGELMPVSLADAEGCASFRGEDIPCLTVDQLDWGRTDLAILAVAGPAVQRLAKTAVAHGCQVVGVKRALPLDPEATNGLAHRAVGACAAAILRVIRPLAKRYGVSALSGFVGLPVAARGREGVEELANQSRGLFALESAEPEVFPVQIAFNLIPQVGENELDATEFESDLRDDLGRVLGESLGMQWMAAWVPTFYGGVVALHGISKTLVSIKEIHEMLDNVLGVTVMDLHMPGGVPTPATDAVASVDVFLGRLKVDARDKKLFSLWLTFDQPRLQAAQILDVVEKLIERKTRSVLP
jgi:aspartate-semialdehyde dehydrogenase